MKSLYKKLGKLTKHLSILNKTFLQKKNYSNISDYKLYKSNYDKFEKLSTSTNLKYSNIKTKSKGKTKCN